MSFAMTEEGFFAIGWKAYNGAIGIFYDTTLGGILAYTVFGLIAAFALVGLISTLKWLFTRKSKKTK